MLCCIREPVGLYCGAESRYDTALLKCPQQCRIIIFSFHVTGCRLNLYVRFGWSAECSDFNAYASIFSRQYVTNISEIVLLATCSARTLPLTQCQLPLASASVTLSKISKKK